MLVFKLLHILSMFAAATFLVGEALLYARAIRRGDVAGLAAVRRLVGGRPVLGASFLVAGVAFGVLTALTGPFDFFAGWLIAAYVLVVAMFVVNGSPWVQRLPRLAAEAIEAEAGQRPADEVIAVMVKVRNATLIAVALNVLLFTAIILDMVLKPF
jgi:uncharacterized membrane protein